MILPISDLLQCFSKYLTSSSASPLHFLNASFTSTNPLDVRLLTSFIFSIDTSSSLSDSDSEGSRLVKIHTILHTEFPDKYINSLVYI